MQLPSSETLHQPRLVRRGLLHRYFVTYQYHRPRFRRKKKRYDCYWRLMMCWCQLSATGHSDRYGIPDDRRLRLVEMNSSSFACCSSSVSVETVGTEAVDNCEDRRLLLLLLWGRAGAVVAQATSDLPSSDVLLLGWLMLMLQLSSSAVGSDNLPFVASRGLCGAVPLCLMFLLIGFGYHVGWRYSIVL